ncbi:exodeoxyribonuclease VII large subunit [Membranihabitans marinus]|uniref:exodeoxyribonuclease VII large subunit n=1 Tax=Membranihabitans marinus TaxID=1227546 RepID=UPI001F0192F3|nr:exodeoxyribonuclease VII large subunit [Membranihabitans marinus]
MKHFSLFDLHQYIERIFLLNFEECIWIEAEIAENNLNNGNYYLSLIEKTETGGLLAQASAALWRNHATAIKKKLGNHFNKILQPGSKVRLYCDVKFHPRYGYKLHIVDVDLDYSMGHLFLERQKTLAKLESNQLFDLNKQLTLPDVIQRIAVISSPHAAGYQDFVHQLQHNSLGYKVSHDLFASKMQGDEVSSTLNQAMERIHAIAQQYDVIVMVRGGGGSMDLSDFDQYEVAEAIAKAPLPVVSGIGHDKDMSVTDMVAYKSVKTPTAVAEFILYHNQKFESEIIDIYNDIAYLAQKNLSIYINEINQIYPYLTRQIGRYMQAEEMQLQKLDGQIYGRINKIWKKEYEEINQLLQNFTILTPNEAMQQGYAMLFQDRIWIKNLNDLSQKKPFTIQINTDKLEINDQK